MKKTDCGLGILFSFSLILILLITSAETVIYFNPGYFEREYEKYDVPAKVNMEMKDVLYVTDEMMDYLHGDRDKLQVTTVIDGSEREFFNEREIAHMEDVRDLFLEGLMIRRIAAGAALGSLFILWKRKTLKFLPKFVVMGISGFFVLALLLIVVVQTDFSKYFIIFHQMFFDNDLWIMNSETDLLINLVPEAFFVDTAFWIVGIFGISLIVVLAISLAIIKRALRLSG